MADALDPYWAGLRLHRIATLLYGDEWSVPVAKLSGLSLRTCQRVKAGVLSESPDRHAPVVHAAVIDTLQTLLVEAMQPESRMSDYVNLERTFARRVLSDLDDSEDISAAVVGPYYAVPMDILVSRAGSHEAAVWDIARTAADALSNPESAEAKSEFLNELCHGLRTLDGLFAFDINGCLLTLQSPQPFIETHGDGYWIDNPTGPFVLLDCTGLQPAGLDVPLRLLTQRYPLVEFIPVYSVIGLPEEEIECPQAIVARLPAIKDWAELKTLATALSAIASVPAFCALDSQSALHKVSDGYFTAKVK